MYVSNETHILLIEDDEVTVIVEQLGGNIVGLAVDEARNRLFWSNNDIRYKGIYTSTQDGMDIRKIVSRGRYCSI